MPLSRHGTHLELKAVEKSFGANVVLKGVDLEIEPGEFVAIVGRSGCGKSTLLRLIAGLGKSTSGDVLLDGQRSSRINPTVRMMFQDSRLLPWEQVLDNVELGLLGIKGPTRQDALRVLGAVGLADRAHDWPSVLSGGQRQRVALARALACDPRLLLLDEPLGALDALTRIEMQRLLEELWQEKGFTSLLITHDVEEAVILADRIILIEDGQIAQEWRVPLSRPRNRGNAVFAHTVEAILERVMDQDVAPSQEKSFQHQEVATAVP